MPADPDDPPIREFADRGVIWLLEHPPNVAGLIRVVAADLADRLDFSRAVRLNRSLIPAGLHKQEADLIFRVPYRHGGGEVLIILLIEHQSAPDRAMALRLLGYMVQLWEQQRQGWKDARKRPAECQLTPIVPVVLYTGKRHWRTPIDLGSLIDGPADLAPFVPEFKALFLSVGDLSAEEPAGSAIIAVLQVLRSANSPLDVVQRELKKAILFLESLPPEAQVEWRRAIHFLVLLVRHKRVADERPTLYNVLDEAVSEQHRGEVGEMRMTIAQADEAKGRREGRLEILIDMLEAKFGRVPDDVRQTLTDKPDSELRQIGRRLFGASSFDDLGLTNKPV